MVMDSHIAAIYPERYLEQTIILPSTNKTKPRNLLGLKLRIDAVAADKIIDVLWTSNTSEESSPSSLLSPSKCLRGDDSGFSSDDNAQCLFEEGSKLSRSKSLRSALRTPTPTSSESHKTVRFADSLGLDLEHKNYYEADECSDELNAVESPFSSTHAIITKRSQSVGLSLVELPEHTDAEICHLTRTQFVCLQSVKVVDTNITGIINVLNVACAKKVYVRYTTDNWETNTETAARYSSPIGNDGAVDAFSFDSAVDAFSFFISLPTDLPIGATCQFCIRYVVNDTEYWDSNQGGNYTIQAVEKGPMEEKAENKATMKPPKPTYNARNRKIARDRIYNDIDRISQFDFLPFSMRSASRNGQWRRTHENDKDYFLKC